MKKTNKIGFAVIGYGGMGNFHVINSLKIPELELIGIYDIDPKRLEQAEDADIHAFQSREELLADERIQLVTVATPNDVHKEIVIAALNAGKNVICEKPVTMTVADLQDMIDCANKNGKLFTVHQNRRWDPDYLTAKQIYDDNMLGPVFNIESRVHGSRGIPGDWRNKKAQGGGMVLDWGIHLLDQMLMMMEGRKLISVYAQLTDVTNEECDDGFKVIAKFEGDLNWEVEVATNNFISLPRWYILGVNGSAVIEDWDRNGKIVMVSDWENRDAVPVVAGVGLTKTMAPRKDDTIKEYPLPKPEGDWAEFYRNVVKAIKGEESALITHEQEIRLIGLVEAIFKSAQTNSVVYFNE